MSFAMLQTQGLFAEAAKLIRNPQLVHAVDGRQVWLFRDFGAARLL
jgi:hypothetical protein